MVPFNPYIVLKTSFNQNLEGGGHKNRFLPFLRHFGIFCQGGKNIMESSKGK